MLFNRSMNKTLHGDELIIIFFSIIQDIIKTAGSFQRAWFHASAYSRSFKYKTTKFHNGPNKLSINKFNDEWKQTLTAKQYFGKDL